ncbi:MAG TPA: membrane-bound lytic murein transglycosylase MltF [Xanthomonadales bacterium]|nr:membrane-bound lytic murein transglycosylase MltF [Xanthomonadales bacterium]
MINKALTFLFGIVLLPFLFSGDDRPSQLEQIQQRGSMKLLTRNGASSYYLGAEGPTGPEYVLARQFSRYLDVVLEVEVAHAFSQLKTLLNEGKGDFIAANLTRTSARELAFNFGPDYLDTQILAITRKGRNRPGGVEELVGRNVMILAGSSYEEALADARLELPELEWEARDDVGIEDLLLAVSDGAIDVTLVDSNIFSINKDFYPNLTSAFVVEESVPHAWAFRRGNDDSLVEQARSFMLQAEDQGRLAMVIDRFYSVNERLDQIGMFHFLERARERLPALVEDFRVAGETYDIDWRLLAAVGYQESHWDPDASSYTGVRGIMMLTEQTAAQLGVDDRLDPAQSIDGGARYLVRLRARLPSRIPETDRTWMALAAYNMGMGHLRDARKLTQARGLNADSWQDVSTSLDLLSQEKWYSQTRYGYARGFEAKKFVANIQRYFETLVWMDTREHPLMVAQKN